MTHQFLIASYAKDFPWLEWNLRSLRRFQKGFLPPVVVVDGSDFFAAKRLVAASFPEATVEIKDSRRVMGQGSRGYGFIRAQIAMMSGDLHCPKADFVYLLGSDCCAFRDLTPDQYFFKGKPVMLWNTFEEIGPQVEQWRTSTNEVLQLQCTRETMRRLPLAYPRALFPALRAHVEKVHGLPFEDYLHRKGLPFSESNLLGTYAQHCAPEAYVWLHAVANNAEYLRYMTQPAGTGSIIQWWSHGGLSRPSDANVEYRPGKFTLGRSPMAVMREILGAA